MMTCIEAEDVILIHGRMIQNSGGMEGLQNCAHFSLTDTLVAGDCACCMFCGFNPQNSLILTPDCGMLNKNGGGHNDFQTDLCGKDHGLYGYAVCEDPDRRAPLWEIHDPENVHGQAPGTGHSGGTDCQLSI